MGRAARARLIAIARPDRSCPCAVAPAARRPINPSVFDHVASPERPLRAEHFLGPRSVAAKSSRLARDRETGRGDTLGDSISVTASMTPTLVISTNPDDSGWIA